jgi:putative ABC transport system substrate-binding protein
MKRIICSLALFFTWQGLQADAGAWKEWLSLSPQAIQSWETLVSPGTPYMVSLRAKGTADQSAKKILVLFPKKSSAYDTALDTILRVFMDRNIPSFFTAFFYGGEDEAGREALRFAESQGYDLLFSMGSASTVFIHDHYRNGAIPVVTVCSKDPVLRGQVEDYESGSGTNIAYTSLDMNTKLQLEYLLKLKKDLKHIIILYAAQNKSVIDTQVIPLRKESRPLSIACHDVIVQNNEHSREELAKKMAVMTGELGKTGDAIYWITGATEIFREIETIVQYAGRIPVLSVVPDVVQEGDNSAVLSLGIGFESNAHKAALYAADILNGKAKAGELPVGVVSPPDMAINFRKAGQIGLKIPFAFFESATIVFDNRGIQVRPEKGKE